MTLVWLIKETYRRDRDFKRGKIDWWHGYLAYVPPEAVPTAVVDALKNRRRYLEPTANGHRIWLKGHAGYISTKDGLGYICRNLPLWGGKRPPSKNKAEETTGHWVSAADCRKCQFYRAKKDSPEKHPVCMFQRVDNPDKAAALEMLDTFSGAAQKAHEVLEGDE